MNPKAFQAEVMMFYEEFYDEFEMEFEEILEVLLMEHSEELNLFQIEQQVQVRGYLHINQYLSKLVETYMEAAVYFGGNPVPFQDASEKVLRDWGFGFPADNLRSIINNINTEFRRLALLSAQGYSQDFIKYELKKMINYNFFRLRRTMRTELVRTIADVVLDVLEEIQPDEIYFNNDLESETCEYCKGLAENSPYTLKTLPRIPQHPHCACYYSTESNIK